MKATGIVRRIDELGRVVIPKEIRRTQRIRRGDPLEIFTTGEGEVIFKKYSPVGELSGVTTQYVDALSKSFALTAFVCDRDRILTASGAGRRDLIDRSVSQPLERLMDGRKPYASEGEAEKTLLPCEGAQRVGDILLNNALLIIMAIAVVYIAIKNPNFIKPASLINILSQTAAYLPAALGIGGCIVLTGTDLSAGRAVGITACISASLLQNAANMANKMWPQIGTLPIPVVIVLAMLIGAAIGCFNGFFVAKFKLHPFIVTLGTQLILYTVLLLYVQQGNRAWLSPTLTRPTPALSRAACSASAAPPSPTMCCSPLC